MPDAPPSPVRLSEIVATMSLVSDLGMGVPMERALRQTVIAQRLADAAGFDGAVRTASYYISLLAWVGCATITSEVSELFGDETELYADMLGADLGGMDMARFTLRHLGRGRDPLPRLGMVGRFVLSNGRSVEQVIRSHCEAASNLAEQLELGSAVAHPLLQKFERWDGRGVPGDAREEGLAPAIRLIHLAESVETFWQRGGVQAAATMARERRGGQFDPGLVDSFLADPGAVTDGLGSVQAWDQVIALDPALGDVLSEVELERALEAFADFADLKAPERTGHSRALAALVDAAARAAGFDVPETTVVRRAALVHDLGRIGIPSTIWNQTTPWSAAQRERKQTYPYLTGRMLSRLPGLGEVSRCAAMHHERLDGSGYPNGLRREALGRAARLLAAADVFQSLREERVRRPALDMAQAPAALRDEVRAGRLDAESVAAVLQAAGTRRRRRAALPGGLTEREAEVLVHLARGRSNREIADALVVSQKTIGAHLEHIYTKLGVRTRTQAALYAMREGLAPGVD